MVLTDNFAGVERYVCQVANGLTDRGHRVDVVGGDPVRMRAELDRRVSHRPATHLVAGTRALLAERGTDLVHVHMTAAEALPSSPAPSCVRRWWPPATSPRSGAAPR